MQSLLLHDCGGIAERIVISAVFWIWFVITLGVAGHAAMIQQSDVKDLRLLAFTQGIVGKPSSAEVTKLAADLESCDRLPSLFDTLAISPWVLLLLGFWIVFSVSSVLFQNFRALVATSFL